jgi:hypothetical protein
VLKFRLVQYDSTSLYRTIRPELQPTPSDVHFGRRECSSEKEQIMNDEGLMLVWFGQWDVELPIAYLRRKKKPKAASKFAPVRVCTGF